MSVFLDLSNVTVDKKEFATPTAVHFTPGEYFVRCVEVELKTAKSGGKYLNCKFKFAANEEYEAMHIYHMFNIENSNAQTKRIGLEQLKTFLLAAGHTGDKLEKITDLIGLTAFAKVVTDVYMGREQLKIKYFTDNDSKPVGGESLFQ